MQFHYEKTLERGFETLLPVEDDTPAWLLLSLASALRDWFGQSHKVACQQGQMQVQFGYEVQSVPVLEFAQTFGPLIYKVASTWPVQVFGMSDRDELVELSFVQIDGKYTLKQRNISGVWYDELCDFYICITFPNALAAEAMALLLSAAEDEENQVVALDWSYSDFLEEQKLAQMDRTLSFCYVSFLQEIVQECPEACLTGLALNQKQTLWKLFLAKHLSPPEFEWIKDMLPRHGVPNWIEWQLALYQVLDELGIRFSCCGNQFELLNCNGERLYFGVNHPSAAEHVLMKVLFPLNQ